MNHSPKTRQSLLIRIRESNESEAWDSFVEIYAPMIHAYARRRGIQEADAADITQQVLRSVVGAIGEFDYQPEKGSFRGWLFRITKNHLIKSVQRQARTPLATGDTAFQTTLGNLADEQSDEEAWNRDHEAQLFRWASERAKQEFREATWQAFWQTAVENRAAREVADELGLSVGAVYIAKSRIVARLREIIAMAEP